MADTTLPVQDTLLSSGVARTQDGATLKARRTTILPQVKWSGESPTMMSLSRSRFEEVDLLGVGGMGEVVLAKDHDIERTVALKRLPPECQVDLVARFVEEIRTVGQLDHPNIVPVHDVGVDEDGRYYFVMKHLEGETLEGLIQRLRDGDPQAHLAYPFDVRLQIVLSILHGVAQAHRKGYIHRDLKPANVMIGPYGQVTVMDWGLAKRIHAGLPAPPLPGQRSEPVPAPEVVAGPRDGTALATRFGAVMGTPMYMSPEQALGAHDSLDERSDLYSVAVLTHELMYLEHYLGRFTELADILKGVRSETPVVHDVRTSPHQPHVPAEIGWFVLKGLAKPLEERFQTAEEMIDELQRVIAGNCRVQCHRTMAKRALYGADRFIDRHPVLFIVGSTAVASLLLAGLVDSLMRFL